MPNLPTGTVTFLFPDIEGSTKLWKKDPEAMRSEIGDKLGAIEALEGMADLAGILEEDQRAARLWGAAQALHETKGIPRDIDFLAEADARISAVRLGIGEGAWEEAWRKGRAMTIEDAIAYALEDEGAGSRPGETPA